MGVIEVTEAGLRDRRAEIIRASGVSEEALWAGAEDYTLTTEQRKIVEELLNIDFLLGDDSHRHRC